MRENYRKMQHSGWRFVDAAGTIEEVAARVEAVAFDTVARVGDKPIGTLWNTGDEGEAAVGAVEESKTGMEDAELTAAKVEAAALIQGTAASTSTAPGGGAAAADDPASSGSGAASS